jgi:hypothetical protein
MRYFAWILVGAILATGVVTWVQYSSRNLPRNGILDVLISPDDTRYAPGFTESSFGRIVPGMTIHEVVSVVGHPLRITETTGPFPARTYSVVRGEAVLIEEQRPGSPVDGIVYYYAERGPYFESYVVRNVVFSSDSRVARVVAGFNAD